MIDIHSHILPNIDDGSRDMEESLTMITEAYENGFTSIICTSHYLSDSYDCNKKDRERLISELQDKLVESGIDIKLYNGAEAYISMDLDELIKDDVIPTLNGSRYVLFEVPMDTKVLFLEAVIDKLFAMKLIPILAHPERYSYMQENYSTYETLNKKGVLFQANIGSIVGKHGSAAKKTVKKLLKNDMVSFLATDAHRASSLYIQTNEMLKTASKIVGRDKIEILTKINPEYILDNKII